MSEMPKETKHLDEMTLLLYIERQLDRARGLEVSAHTQECDACRKLLRVLESAWRQRESTHFIRLISSLGGISWNKRDSVVRTCWAC